MQQILPFALIGFGLMCGLALVLTSYFRGSAVCFVRGLNDAQLKLLSDRSIWYEAARLAGASGIHIKRRDRENICTALSSYVLTEFRYSRFGTLEVVLRLNVPDERRSIFAVGNFTEGFKEKLTWLVRDIIDPAAHLGSTTICDCKGRDSFERNNGGYGFAVGFHAKNDDTRQDLPEVLCGYRHGIRTQVSKAGGRGIPLIEPETGFVFGEVIDNSLALFVPLDKRYKVLLPIIAKLLELAAKEINIEGIVEDWAASVGLGQGLVRIDVRAVVRTDVRALGGNRYSRREKILKVLAGRVLTKPEHPTIEVRDYNEQPAVPIQDRWFQVHYAAQPIGLRGVDSMPSGLGLPISVAGKLVGELMPNNLFVYKDVLKHGARADIVKMAEIFYAANRVVDGQNTNAATDALAVDECLHLLRPLFAAQSPSPETLAAADELLAQQTRTAREFEQEQLRLDTTSDHLLGEEFDSIFKLKQVVDVQVSERELLVTTDTLYCQDERTGLTHRIGRFEIHLPYDGSAVRFLNKDGLVRNMNAPHVNTDGSPCLGTIKDMLPNLIRTREFAEAIQVSLAFLESANTDDYWGKHVNAWPVATTGIMSRLRRFGGS